jgi:hypothetical protein
MIQIVFCFCVSSAIPSISVEEFIMMLNFFNTPRVLSGDRFKYQIGNDRGCFSTVIVFSTRGRIQGAHKIRGFSLYSWNGITFANNNL